MSLLKVNEIQIFNGETVTITAPAVVTANDNTNAALRITQTGSGNALVVEDSANPDSTPFVVDASGNVGIGTSSPAALLELEKNGSTSLRLTRTNAVSNYAEITASGGNSEQLAIKSNVNNQLGGYTAFEVGNTERMRIDSSGNVGIGTSSPAQKLDVTGNINATGALTLGTALAVAEGGTGATDAATARINLDVDQAGTDNSTDVTLVTTSHDYLSITGQAITLGPIDLAADVTGTLATSNGGTGVTSLGSLNAADLGSGAATDGYVLTADGAGNAAWEAASGASLPIDLLSSGASIRKSDGTTAVLSESGGTVTLENASLGDTVLMPDNSNNVSTAPGIRFEADTDTGIGLASAGNLAIVTGGTERLRVGNSGKVGINTNSPSYTVDVKGSEGIAAQRATDTDRLILQWDGLTSYANSASAYNNIKFIAQNNSGSVERIRIDGSGNLLVGKTTTDSNTAGSRLGPTGYLQAVRDGAYSVYLNRLSSDGEIAVFAKDGTEVGSIGSTSFADAYYAGAATGIAFGDNNITPVTGAGVLSDNTKDLGGAAGRWDDIYATNSTIQTSDINEKQDIEELSEAEQRVAAAAKGLLRKYCWKSAVVEKGDNARIHFGIIAQDLKAAFEAEGLDAGRYGMFIHSEWWEAEEIYTDDDGVEKTRIIAFDTEEEAPEGAVKKDRMGIRYSELLAFIIAAI